MCVCVRGASSLINGDYIGVQPLEGTLGEGFVVIAVYPPDGFARLGSPVAAVSWREWQVAQGVCLVLFRLACTGLTGPAQTLPRGSLWPHVWVTCRGPQGNTT